MINGDDLMMELQEKIAILDKALNAFGDRGRKLAKAEHDYRVALAKKVLMERDKGTPVTIIQNVCLGAPEIAKLRLERDIAEAMHKSALEGINVHKLEVKILQSTIDREWGRQ